MSLSGAVDRQIEEVNERSEQSGESDYHRMKKRDDVLQ